jgi:thiamine biosynthesis protein ThiS
MRYALQSRERSARYLQQFLRKNMSMSVTINVNGQKREVAPGTTLRQLAQELSLSPEKVAIELNRRLVRAEKLDSLLAAGDEVEIVTFVGGG